VEHLSRLNRLVYRIERVFVAVALLAMAWVVFFDVLHRAFSGERTKAIDAFIKVIDWFGPDLSEGNPGHETALVVLPWLGFAIFAGLGWAAMRASTRGRMSHVHAAGFAIGGTIVAYGLVQLLVRMLPNGLIWSQPLALVLTLWVGFLGASMATYEHKHLKVEAVVRLFTPNVRRYVGFVSSFATAMFCFGLMWVSIRYVLFSHDEYTSTAGQGGLVSGTAVPKYQAFLALPISFGIMCARFMGIGVLALQGKLKEDDPLAGLVDEATKQAVAQATAPPPSDIPTEAVRPIRDEPPSKPVSAPRPVASAGDIVSNRPSEVVTDRHSTPHGRIADVVEDDKATADDEPALSREDKPASQGTPKPASDDEGGAR
jgi:TRAP-type C4-dicarboxylate transport system permease small subunit